MAAAEPLMDSQIVIVRPDAEVVELEQRSDPLVRRAQSLLVVDDAEYQAAGEFLLDLKAMQKEVTGTLAEPIQKAHEAHKSLTTLRAKHLDPLKQAEKLVKSKMGAFVEEQERQAREEQRQREEEARREAEEARLRQAEKLEQQGQTAAAEAVLDAPIVAPSPPPVSPQAPPKAAGISTVKRFSAQVVDLEALIVAAATNPHLRQFLLPNQKALDALARNVGTSMDVPGVVVQAKTDISARGN